MFYKFGALFSFDFCLCSSEVIGDIGVLCTILVVVSHTQTSITIKTETKTQTTGWGTRVYLWRIHFDIWQNQYNIVKLKNKIKLKKKKTKKQSLCSGTTREIGWRGIWEGLSGWGRGKHEYLWLIHVDVWQIHHNIVR